MANLNYSQPSWKRLTRRLFGWPKVTDLERFQMMDVLDQLIIQLSRQVVKHRKSPQRRYWEAKWEEAVMVYMEFEDYYHPRSPSHL